MHGERTRHPMIRKLNVLLLVCLASLLGWKTYIESPRFADHRILFVGNSYIYTHNVPGMLRRMAASAAPPLRLHTEMIAQPEYHLAQHIADGTAQAEIASGDWDTVILQEQSAGAFSMARQIALRAGIATLSGAATDAGARSLVYAHWPPGDVLPAQRPSATRQIEFVYREAARPLGAGVIRIGALWQDAARAGMSGLYGPDGHHAGPLGAYAAALAVLHALDVTDVATVDWVPRGIAREEARALVRLAADLPGPDP